MDNSLQMIGNQGASVDNTAATEANAKDDAAAFEQALDQALPTMLLALLTPLRNSLMDTFKNG
jgi:hypothetical protein